MNECFQKLRHIIPRVTPAELEHVASFPMQFFNGFDEADMDRLIVTRRAVQAGF